MLCGRGAEIYTYVSNVTVYDGATQWGSAAAAKRLNYSSRQIVPIDVNDELVLQKNFVSFSGTIYLPHEKSAQYPRCI